MKNKIKASTGQGAGAIIYCTSTGRALLGLRSHGGDYGGTWCCFGGGIDPTDKGISYAIARELSEECGTLDIDCPPMTFKGVFHSSKEKSGYQYHNCIITCESEFEPRLNDEHTDYTWAPIGQFPVPIHPKFAKAIGEAQAAKNELLINILNHSSEIRKESIMATMPKSWLAAKTMFDKQELDQPQILTAKSNQEVVLSKLDMSREVAGRGLSPITGKQMTRSHANGHPVWVDLENRVVVPVADQDLD